MMSIHQKSLRSKWLASLVLASVQAVLITAAAHAAEAYRLEFGGREATSELRLTIGRSQIINSPETLDQVVIGNPAVADIKLLSSRQVLILGNKPGHTNLVFRNKDRALVAVIDVEVGYDMDGIKRKIYEALPAEKNVEIRGINDSVILTGEVSNLLAMDSVLSIASSYVPKDKVINHLQVGGGQQVMLEAKVAEVARSSMKEFGFDIFGENVATDGRGFTTTTGPVRPNLGSNTSLLPPPYFGKFSFTDSIMKGGLDSIDITLRLLETKGLAKTLAEPNIVALSGQEASFLAGGQIPIPVTSTGAGSAQTVNSVTVTTPTVTIQYKEFGIGLKFTPTVLNSNKINLQLNAEVSALDTANSANWGLGNIPALTTRRTSTTIEMGDGQSFAIAGLMQSNMNNAINQLPGLGNIPILGALFRSSRFQRNETELVVVVTPRIVKPMPGSKIRLPTDNLLPPNDVDMYLLGRMEKRISKKRTVQRVSESNAQMHRSLSLEGGVDGAYGHQL